MTTAGYSALGQRVPRIEGTAKATGATLYAADLNLPRMVHCKVLRAPLAHAIIKRIDSSKARTYPGVVGVFTAADIPNLPKETPTRAHDVLAREEIIFYGQPIAAVVAEGLSIAEEALDLIEVEYQELPVVVDPLKGMEPDSPLTRRPLREVDRSEEMVHTAGAEPAKVTYATLAGPFEAPADSNVTQRMIFSRGDVERGFAEADLVLERRYRASWVHQGYLEPQVAIADYDSSGHYTVWTSTQGQFMVRSQLANILDVPETRITVIGLEVGGAFGAKVMAFNAGLVCFLAEQVRRPVKLVMSRSEDLKAANPAPQAYFELKTGAKRDGALTALRARVVFDSGAYPGGPLMAGTNLLGGYYRWPNLEIEGFEVITNRANVGALRAPGTPQATFAIESQMDIMARELGLDPLEFRLKNVVEEGSPMPNGRVYPRIGLRECLETIGRTELWRRRHEKGPNEGVGLAVGGWLGGAQPASATVTLNTDGTITVITGANDITGVNTSFQQIAAAELGLSLKQVTVKSGDTSNTSYVGVSGGSKTLRTVGHAVALAAQDARQQMFRIVAERLECRPEDLECEGGLVRVKGSPDKALSLQILATMSTGIGAAYPPIVGKGNSGPLGLAPGFTTAAVKLRVDSDTGAVTLLDAACAQDVGFAVNPLSVEGQIQGGVFQSLGIGLCEELLFDDQGRLLNPTLLDYRIPTALDTPPIQALLVEVPAPGQPFGARGVGEPPIAASCAALANAVYDACGARVYQMPLTAERILGSLGRL